MKITATYLRSRAYVRAMTRNDLYLFNKAVLKYDKICERIHRPMCQHFQPPLDTDERDFALLIEPRGIMKTSFNVIGLSTWLICFDPNVRILIYSSTHAKAKERLFVVKNHLLLNTAIPFFYGDFAKFARSKVMWKAESVIVHGRTSTDLEPTIDTGGRGIDKCGSHYNWIIIDDIENDKTVQSQDELEATKRYVLRLFPCMLPKRSYLRIIGTLWSDGDVYSMIMGTDPEYEHRYDYFRVRTTSAENEDGSLYFPEVLSERFLKIERDSLGDYMYSLQYLSTVLATGDLAFPPVNTMYWYGKYYKQGSASHLRIDKIKKRNDDSYAWMHEHDLQIRLYMLVDPALSEEEQACYSAIVMAGKDIQYGKIWVVDAYRIKSIDAAAIIKEMIRLYIRYEPTGILIENQGWQHSIKGYFEKEARQQHIYCRPEPVGRKDHRSKLERILGLSPYWQSDSLLLPGHILIEEMRDNPIRALREELYRYPKSKYKDLSDALSRINDTRSSIGQKNLAAKIKEADLDYYKAWRPRRITDATRKW